ncbi:hypothetical protein NMG60_11035418 [Bertholletia excelsa]
MASTFSKTCLALLLAMFICSQSARVQSEETMMSLYFQILLGGPNATLAPITGIPGKVWSLASFGTLFGVDNPVTEGLGGKSAAVGRAQASCTIELHGTNRQTDTVREVAVVGGTGKFRFAKGYATFETAYVNAPTGYVVTRCNITLQVS